MNDVMELTQNEDGTFSTYDDTYDITIHCETEEKRKEIIACLESTNWIPVSKRLPEIKNYEECYLVTDGKFIWMAYWTPEKEWILADCTNCKNKIDWTGIVAWKPLPELYKED